jgi:hypothetical protein
MIHLPQLALSVRQPWTWAIIHAGKPVENRDWQPGNPGLKFRGPICLHASSGMTRAEYEEARRFMWTIGVRDVPARQKLERGGIVGTANVVDVVREHPSRWFFGPLALVLEDVKPVDFIEAKGALGFFDWRRQMEERR